MKNKKKQENLKHSNWENKNNLKTKRISLKITDSLKNKMKKLKKSKKEKKEKYEEQ